MAQPRCSTGLPTLGQWRRRPPSARSCAGSGPLPGRPPPEETRSSAGVAMREAAWMTSSDRWDAQTAERYDETSAFMYAADVLEPAVGFLAELAGDGPA